MKSYIHHIVLTVTDPARSAEFYSKVLDWKVTEQKDDHAYLCPDNKEYPDNKFMIVLGKSRDKVLENNSFDRNKVGLDHFAFNIDSMEELKKVESRLKQIGIEMEEDGITDDDFGGTAIFCSDPDGMKVEFHLSE